MSPFNVDMGEYIASEFEVRNRVFSRLSLEDLVTCRLVCKSWKIAADFAEDHRRKLQVLAQEDAVDTNFKEFIRCEAGLVITLLPGNPKTLFEDSRFCEKEVNFHCTLGQIRLLKNRKRVSMPRARFFSTTSNKNQRRVSIRFPKMEGIHYEVFSYSYEEIKWTFPKNITIRCVIMITSGMTYAESLFKFIRNRQKEDVAVAGCILTGNNDEVHNTYILIGGENVVASSTVLSDTCRTKGEIVDKLREFRDAIPECAVKDSVIFVFRCCERRQVCRAYNYRPNENVDTWEAEALVRTFPHTEIVGMVGGGEFGRDVAHQQLNPEVWEQTKFGDFFKTFSTCLLHIGIRH